MTVSRGDLVLLNVPFTHRRGSKLRPMLVVQNDRNNARMANTILVVITTNTRRAHEPTQVLIDPATPEGSPSGLVAPSVVSCENLLTVPRARIVRKMGRLPDSLLARVDQALKASLALP